MCTIFILGLVTGGLVLIGQALVSYRPPKNKLW